MHKHQWGTRCITFDSIEIFTERKLTKRILIIRISKDHKNIDCIDVGASPQTKMGVLSPLQVNCIFKILLLAFISMCEIMKLVIIFWVLRTNFFISIVSFQGKDRLNRTLVYENVGDKLSTGKYKSV